MSLGLQRNSNSRHPGVELCWLADRLNGVYREFFEPVTDIGPGSTPADILQRLTGVDESLAMTMVDYLSESERRSVQDGEDPMYDATTKYRERFLNSRWSSVFAWEEFKRRIWAGRRYFDVEAKRSLAEVFAAIKQFGKGVNSVGTRNLAAGDTGVFRGRATQTAQEAQELASNPDRLNAPPIGKAPAGRMNPAGLPVLYGAFSPDTCIAEARPVVGGYVVVAEFAVTESVRLLDLPEIGSSEPDVSMFAPDYADVTGSWLFLRSFDDVVARPVTPVDEDWQYIPTQAVAEFAKHELRYDGIVYSSAQAGSRRETTLPRIRGFSNVVFFGEPLSPADDELDFGVPQQPRFPLTQVKDSIRVYGITSVSHGRELLRLDPGKTLLRIAPDDH